MPKNNSSTNNSNHKGRYTKSKWGVGVGLGAAAAIAAVSYFLYGTKEGAKRRAQMRGWAMKARGEIADRMERMRDIDGDRYSKLVDQVLEKYKRFKHIDPQEVRELADDLKRHWKNIRKDLETKEREGRRR